MYRDQVYRIDSNLSKIYKYGSPPILAIQAVWVKKVTWFSFCLTKWQHMEDSWEHIQWFLLCHTINFTVNKGDHLCGPLSVFFPCGTSWADQNFKAITSLTSIRPFKGYCLKAGMKLPTERVGPGRGKLTFTGVICHLSGIYGSVIPCGTQQKEARNHSNPCF